MLRPSCRFGVSPCQPTSSPDSSTISIVRDFDVLVPYANYTDVLVWFQQFRYERVNGTALCVVSAWLIDRAGF